MAGVLATNVQSVPEPVAEADRAGRRGNLHWTSGLTIPPSVLLRADQIIPW